MKRTPSLIGTFVSFVSLLLFACGCDFHIGNWAQAKYEKIVHQQGPLEPGSTLKVGTSSGSITITGADVTDCNMVADITVRAPSEAEAQEIAEKVSIVFERSDKTLTIRADKPHVGNNRSISVSYNIIVPMQTIVQCGSSYGAIRLTNINGSVSGKTSSGSVTAENIEGLVDLNTSYGPVTCKDISGSSIVIRSSSGSISAEKIKGSAQFNTSYGSIICRDVSGGDAVLKTSSGKIELSKASLGNCDAHTSYGSIVVEDFKGDIIKLHSDSGGIDVTETSIKTADISTSYGHIICRQIMTQELTARSGSGGISIVCSDSTPSEMKAEIVTSYGSIDFTAPPEFSGEVELGTSYGSIATDIPITITGQVNKRKLTGTIGSGHGKLYLRTSSGSIHLR
jgi:DUF4097 and DUF4098 domain-containing protein YvlB